MLCGNGDTSVGLEYSSTVFGPSIVYLALISRIVKVCPHPRERSLQPKRKTAGSPISRSASKPAPPMALKACSAHLCTYCATTPFWVSITG